MNTTSQCNDHLFNVSRAIVGNDPGLLGILFKLVSTIHAIGGIMTGSVHPLF